MNVETQRIQLNEVGRDVLEELVRYVYTNEININGWSMHGIFTAAVRYKFNELVAKCKQIYRQSFDATNVLAILHIAEELEQRDLEQWAWHFAYNHFSDVVLDPAFLTMEPDALSAYLASDKICIVSEEDVFDAIARWILHKAGERKGHYVKLLKTLRLSKIDEQVSVTIAILAKMSFLQLMGKIEEWSAKMNLTKEYLSEYNEKKRQDSRATDQTRRYKRISGQQQAVSGSATKVCVARLNYTPHFSISRCPST